MRADRSGVERRRRTGRHRWARGLLLVLPLVTCSPSLAGSAFAASPGDPRPTVDVIVRLDRHARLSPGALVALVGGRLGTEIPLIRGFTAEVPPSGIDRLRAVAGVMEVTEDAGLDLSPPDPVVPADHQLAGFVDGDFGDHDGGRSFEQLGLPEVAKIVGADQVWGATTGQGVDVAVIDTGVSPVPGVGAVLNGPDLSFDGDNPALRHLDAYGHGTHMAGIVQAVAPGARLVNVKIGAADGAADVSQAIAAVDWVVQHRSDDGLNIRVLLLAYGTDGAQPSQIDPLAYATEMAWRHGIVVVAAAGNRGQAVATLDNPALDPYVVAVGASEANGTYSSGDDTVAAFTNGGSDDRGVDVVAPGRSVVSLRVPGSFIDQTAPEARTDDGGFRGSGTSQAAAAVAGVSALMVAERPALQPDQVKSLLMSTGRDLPRSATPAQGGGEVHAPAAVAGDAPRPGAAAQRFAPGTGTGSLEAARGSVHVAVGGVPLVGETTVLGQPWSGVSWSGLSWSGGSWSGLSWSGLSWSGVSWSGVSWSGGSWSASAWPGLRGP
ncbi:MAG: S8 family serine peptidase [Acidimicrobiia bacterium]